MGVQTSDTHRNTNQMKYLLSLVSLASLTYSSPQLVFGGSEKTDDAGPRLGLLASNLGLSATGSQDPRSGSQDPRSGSLEEFPSGRVPGAPSVGAEATASVQTSTQDQCCCIAADQDCFDLYNVEDDLVGQGLIDPRIVN